MPPTPAAPPRLPAQLWFGVVAQKQVLTVLTDGALGIPQKRRESAAFPQVLGPLGEVHAENGFALQNGQRLLWLAQPFVQFGQREVHSGVDGWAQRDPRVVVGPHSIEDRFGLGVPPALSQIRFQEK